MVLRNANISLRGRSEHAPSTLTTQETTRVDHDVPNVLGAVVEISLHISHGNGGRNHHLFPKRNLKSAVFTVFAYSP